MHKQYVATRLYTALKSCSILDYYSLEQFVTPVVNFINVFCLRFLYKILAPKVKS